MRGQSQPQIKRPGTQAPALWLLDTCALSELARPSPHPWLGEHAVRSAIAGASIGEIQRSVFRMPAGQRRLQVSTRFDGLCAQFSHRILACGAAVWREFGRPQDDWDLLIAAIAHIHNLTLLTRNTQHFADCDITWLNPSP